MATGFIFIFTALLIANSLVTVQNSCTSDLVILQQSGVITIQEYAHAGVVLRHVTNDIELKFENPANGFVYVVNGSIMVSREVLLDGPENVENCKIANDNQLVVKFCCGPCAGQKTDIYYYVNMTDDFGPEFTAYETSAEETLSVGSSILQLDNITSDPDCTNSFHFSIDNNSSNFFRVDNTNKRLLLTQPLDFEVKREYFVNLTVSSKILALEGKVNSTILTVHVIDKDDMSPVFDVGQFQLHVFEGQDISNSWLSASPPILARDGDVGINTTLVYSIDSVTPNMTLQIQKDTGQIRVLDILDRENTSAYIVVVKAAQVDAAYRTATATLSILVDDENDNRPVYTSQRAVTIREDTPNGTEIMELSGIDLDEGRNAQFSFVIVSDSLGAFGVNPRPGTTRAALIVRNSIVLRGQTEAIVQIKLMETEAISGGGSCDQPNCVVNLTVTITDVNDHAPMFGQKYMEFTVPSNSTGHLVIGQVAATDDDKGDNAKIVYSLSVIPGYSECSTLSLDPDTGTLSTDQPMLAGVFCSLLVTGCDSPTNGDARMCGSMYVSVTVVLSGDITQRNITVLENVDIGTIVTTMSVKGLRTTSTEFGIRNDVLYTKVLLDRETQDNYVVAVQSGQDANSTIMNINVYVEDVNDNPPIFEQSVYVINLDGDASLNKTVLQVKASDKDIGNNSLFAFSLVNGREFFEINSRTGQITLVNLPTNTEMDYQLLATDFGVPSLTGLSSIRVYTPLLNETASLILPVSWDELMNDRVGVAKKLSDILGVVVKILSIQSLGPVPDVGSKLYIIATSADGQPISPTELNGLLGKHAVEIYEKFTKPRPKDDEPDQNGLSSLEIALICVVVALALLVLLVALLWWRSQRKYKQSLRLFDTLNKNTAIYDNPRKLSSTAVVTSNKSNNNGSTNARQMLARLSNGSVGHSSMTNLIPNNEGGSASGQITPPENSSTPRTPRIPHQYYENVLMVNSAISIPGGDDHNAATYPVSALEDENKVTSFGSQAPGEATVPEHPSNQAKISPDGSHAFEFDTILPTGETPNSEPDDNDDTDNNRVISRESQLEDADENDQEVAQILSENISDELNLPSLKEDDVMWPTNPSHDLLNATAEVSPVSTEQPKMAGSSWHNAENTDTIPEPEPDYAKKVRFSEAAATENLDSDNDDDGHTSLGKSPSQEEPTSSFGVSVSENSVDDDIIEELTAL